MIIPSSRLARAGLACFVLICTLYVVNHFTYLTAYIRVQQLEPAPWSIESNSDSFESVVTSAKDGTWRPKTIDEFNEYHLKVLESCSYGGKCDRNNDKLILLGWGHYRNVLYGLMQGENVWCDNIMDGLHALGYSMLVVKDKQHLLSLFRQHYTKVHLILWSNDDHPAEGRECMVDPTCTHQDPDIPLSPPNATHANIPLWKILSMFWWEGPQHPYGGAFTLAPENYATFGPTSHGRNNFYLGYSLEKTCLKTSFVSPEDRPRQVYVMTKRTAFFGLDTYIFHKDRATAATFYKDASAKGNFSFVGTFSIDGDIQVPNGIVQLPRMARPEFQRKVAESRAVFGVGRPYMSPTPWEALCLGVPFINPVLRWDQNSPDNREQWGSQHRALTWLGLDAPYVYHVKAGDFDGVARAIQHAMENPIDRYIPDQMTMPSFMRRLQEITEKDWISVARQQRAANQTPR